jgi:hypothetical protein
MQPFVLKRRPQPAKVRAVCKQRAEGGVWLLASLLVWLVACPGGSDDEDVCAAGESRACVCDDGGSGQQVCLAEGRFGACVCDGADGDASAADADAPDGDSDVSTEDSGSPADAQDGVDGDAAVVDGDDAPSDTPTTDAAGGSPATPPLPGPRGCGPGHCLTGGLRSLEPASQTPQHRLVSLGLSARPRACTARYCLVGGLLP